MKIGFVEVRQRFIKFWGERYHHKEVPPIPLVPQNDPTTLFTGSGMQQFVPNLLGEPHPLGKELFNIQPCLRVQDIEEVGDNRHTTSFEMMGNWSLGTYFKKEQLGRFFDFLTNLEYGLGLEANKLYVTVFEGDKEIPKDTESIKIWQELFKAKNVSAEEGVRIFPYPPDKNWWSRAGIPTTMPPGEPGGPDSEVFFLFDQVEHDQKFGKNCHPNCDCGRFMEIGNSVFMQYQKQTDGTFKELPQKNVDFGGGYERLVSAVNNNPDVFATDLYKIIIDAIKNCTNRVYDNETKVAMRIIADHLKAATFLSQQGIRPSNKEQGYILRRLIRRAHIKMHFLSPDKSTRAENYLNICKAVLETYKNVYFQPETDFAAISPIIASEINKFNASLKNGLKELNKLEKVDGKVAFDLYQSFGFPLELTEELLKDKGHIVDRKQFTEEFNRHKELSRSQSAGKFKGGLADNSEQVLKYHTATHLLHQALSDVLGNDVKQEGSNITGERLRFDFSLMKKPLPEEIKKVENIVNEKINQKLPVHFQIMPKVAAMKLEAKSFFREKYPEMVKVYFIGDYSKEFCGGPHVAFTNEIGKISIYKFEKIGSNLYRVYAR